MERRVVTILLLSGFFSMSCATFEKVMHFVPVKMDWPSARSYCTENFVDMASVSDYADLATLSGLVDTADQYAFVGLKREWQWHILSTADQRDAEITFSKLENEEPQDNFKCGSIQPSGIWASTDCNSAIPFICYNEGLADRYVKVNDTEPFNEAEDYCRTYHTDLARVQNETENQQLVNLTYGEPAWIGLKTKWAWSDGTYPNFVPWALNGGKAHCAAADTFAAPGEMVKWDCNGTLPFFCYSFGRKKLTVKIALSGAENGVRLTKDSLKKLVQNKLNEQGFPKDVHFTWTKHPQKTGPSLKGDMSDCANVTRA